MYIHSMSLHARLEEDSNQTVGVYIPVSSNERYFLLKLLFDTLLVLASDFFSKRALFSLRALNQATGRLLRKGIEAPLEHTLRSVVNVLNRAAAFQDETGKAAQRAHIPATKAQFPATRAHIKKC